MSDLYQHILVALDLDEEHTRVLDKAVALARCHHAKLSVIHVDINLQDVITSYSIHYTKLYDGRRRDLDQYDDDYFHLVLWDPEALEIVGAYRFIPTAGQLAGKGVGGLYSHSLFDFTPAMTQVLAQGIV